MAAWQGKQRHGQVRGRQQTAGEHLQGEVGHVGDDDGVEGLRNCKIVRRPQGAAADVVEVEARHAAARAPDLARHANASRVQGAPAALLDPAHAPGGTFYVIGGSGQGKPYIRVINNIYKLNRCH